MDKIKILVVEDDEDWLKLIVNFLLEEKDLIVVGTALNKDDALQMVKTIDIDVVLMDINLSENKYDGIYAAAEIFEIKKVKIIMLTSLTENEIIIQSFIAGAVNFILKTNFQEIPNVIRAAILKFSPIEVVLNDYYRLKEEEELKPLTPSEREIFKLIAQGNSRLEIEEKLFKSESTLKNQVNSILKKLRVKNFKDAVKKVSRK